MRLAREGIGGIFGNVLMLALPKNERSDFTKSIRGVPIYFIFGLAFSKSFGFGKVPRTSGAVPEGSLPISSFLVM